MNQIEQALDEAGILFYRGSGNADLADRMMRKVGENFGFGPRLEHINFGVFPDGESNNKIPNFKRLSGKTIFFFQSVYKVKLIDEFFEICWAMKHQYGVAKIIAFLPFLKFRRQDPGEKKPHEINRLRMIIQRMKENGVEQLITVTPHSNAMQRYCDEFGILFKGLDVTPEIIRAIGAFLPKDNSNGTLKVYAPDVGSLGRAMEVAKRIGAGVLFNIKQRKENNKIKIVEAKEEQIQKILDSYTGIDLHYATEDFIRGKIILMIEDEMASGETANTTGKMLRDMGAERIYFVFTHAVCNPGWKDKLFDDNPFTKVFAFDTIPRYINNRTGGLIRDISAGDLLASEMFAIISQMTSPYL